MTQLKFSDRRLYAQLRPDDAGLRHITSLQSQVDSGTAVDYDTLHLTLIHFGKVNDMYDAITAVSGVDRTSYITALHQFVAAIETQLSIQPLRLEPSGFDKFGPGGMALVVRYDASAQLGTMHKALYAELIRLLQQLGVTDADNFVQNNSNLQHAKTLRPHVTIALGYKTTPLPTAVLAPVQFVAMPVVY